MHVTLERARQTSWRDAAIWAGEKYGWTQVKEIVFGPGRCDWFPEVPCKPNMRVLDIGSGWGNVSFLMSQRFQEVYSLEGVKERAYFQQIRREQEQIDNLIVVNADLTMLPFKHESFDLIVLNGLLGWIGSGDLSRYPREMQLSLLEHIVRLLKPGGYLYIGTENRACISLFRRGEHLHKRSGRYRRGMYTPQGYQELLNDAGFTNTHISWVHEHYNRPDQSIRIESRNAFRFYAQSEARASIKRQIKYRVLNVLNRCGLLKHVIPCLSIVACKGGERSFSLIEETCYDLCKQGFDIDTDDYLRYTRLSRAMSERARIIYILFNNRTGLPAFVAKLPRTCRCAEVIRKEEKVIGLIASRSCKLNEMHFPTYKHVNGVPVVCEHFFSGTTFNAHLLSGRSYDFVVDWLVDFQAAKPAGKTQMLSAVDYARTAVENLCAYDFVERRVRDYLHLWLDAVSEVKSEPTQCVPVHGDFSASNILLSGDEVFVTDWEWINAEGPPWEDLFAFVFSTGFNTAPDGSNEHRMPENLLASFKGESVHSRYIGRASARFLSKTNLPPSLLISGFLSALACRVDRDFDEHHMSPEQSGLYNFLHLAADERIPLWDLFADIVSQGMTGKKSDNCVESKSNMLQRHSGLRRSGV